MRAHLRETHGYTPFMPFSKLPEELKLQRPAAPDYEETVYAVLAYSLYKFANYSSPHPGYFRDDTENLWSAVVDVRTALDVVMSDLANPSLREKVLLGIRKAFSYLTMSQNIRKEADFIIWLVDSGLRAQYCVARIYYLAKEVNRPFA